MANEIDMGNVVGLIQAMMPSMDAGAISASVTRWLDAHPEATTTVTDGSITEQKLAAAIAAKINQVSQLADEIDAIQPITGTGKITGWLPGKRYSISNGVATLADAAGYSTIRIPAQKGDVFTLNMPGTYGYTNWRAICEVDDDNNVLWKSPYANNNAYILEDYQYVVKNDDTTAVILNAVTDTMGASYLGIVNTKRIKNAEELLKEKYNYGITSHSDELILHQSFFNMDFTADWFLELCFNNGNIPTSDSSNDYLISFQEANNNTASPYIRILRNNFQMMIGSQYIASFGVSNFISGINHLMYICKNHIVSTYVNGNLIETETMTDDTISKLNTFDGLRIKPIFNVTLFRFGTNGDVNPGARYNNTSPYAYIPTPAENVVIDIRPEDFHADYIHDRAGNIYYDFILTIDHNNPFPETIQGNGSPAITPRFIGQKYYDTTAGKWYVANGMSGIGNWVRYADTTELAGKQNTLQSGTTIKTINGTSILGAGNIQIGEGGGGSSGVVVNVVDYGATGDGATDDTNAIMQALEVVRVAGGTLFFPYNAGNCTYLTRKGLVLESNMCVDADRGAILKNASAVLPDAAGNPATGSCAVTTITANLAQGGHSCTVASTVGLAVGQEITIYTNNSAGYTDTHADITAISGSTITFDTSRFTSDGTDGGAVSAHASGSYLFTDFSLIETVKRPSEHITIKNITLQPCGNANEPYVYTISPIHETAQSGNAPQNDFRVIGVTIDGSAQDGISVQGSGDAWVEDCIVKNVKWKGIHFGTSCDKVIIRGNLLDNCGNTAPADDRNYNWGSGGIYWCVNNHRVLVEGNQINNCRRGCFGFDYRGNGETDTDSIISGNTFKSCAYAGVRTEGGWRLNVNGNVFLNFTGASVPIHSEGGTADSGKLQHAVIANNIIGAFENAYTNTLGAIRLDNALYPIVTGNNIQPNTDSTGSAQIVLTGTTGGVITSNVSGGVDVSDSGNVSCVAESNVTVA